MHLADLFKIIKLGNAMIILVKRYAKWKGKEKESKRDG